MEREMILLAGTPGSGKSTLGDNLVRELRPRLSIEHISTGDLVRAIGSDAIKSTYASVIKNHLNSPWPDQPIDNEIIYAITSEALDRVKATKLVLLDGSPRRIGKSDLDFVNSRRDGQVDDVYQLALMDERTILGMVLTVVSMDQAISRLLSRGPRDFERSLNHELAEERIRNYEAELAPVLRLLHGHGLAITSIDSSGDKQSTTDQAKIAVAKLRQKTTLT
ncbi:MAG: nucleoside monophosphate kinase [Candidatus Saccharimonadales bacterium]